jgi:hypothetical protein
MAWKGGDRTNLRGLLLVGFLVAAAVAYFVLDLRQGSDELAAELAKKNGRVTAEELFDLYSGNKIAADRLLKGRPLTVTGEVYRVSTGPIGHPCIAFRRSRGYKVATVLCLFGGADLGRLAELHEGERVVVVGTCGGMMTNVILQNCRLSPTGGPRPTRSGP